MENARIAIEMINWDDFVSYLEGNISNEELWMKGSINNYEALMHEGNILRMEEEIEMIEAEDYKPVFDYYGEIIFKDFLKEEFKK